VNAILPISGCLEEGMAVAEALRRVLDLVAAPLPDETVSIADCAGRFLASPVRARFDLPGCDQSAMDGYAVRSAELLPGAMLPLTGRSVAGSAPVTLAPGAAHRILTGAPVPIGADAVIAQEHVRLDGQTVSFGAPPPSGTNIRRQGEDIRAGDTLIRPGQRLDCRHIAILAAQGLETVLVRQRPRVALLASGRELLPPGATLAAGQIHDSNTPMLAALLTEWGAVVRTRAALADDADAIGAGLAEASAAADLVLTTAGISVGDGDHVRGAIEKLGGDLRVLNVAMKPGKPLAAGRLGGAVFIGLPGNPQAALAGAAVFVRPVLGRLAAASMPPVLHARAGFALQRRPGRTEFIPVSLSQNGACLVAQRSGPEGSGRLAPLLAADGLMMLEPWHCDLRAGEILPVLPFSDRVPAGAS